MMQATTYEKTKDDGKTWYYRGVIYARIDTSSVAEEHALADNALDIAMESFQKAEAMSDGKNEYFTIQANGLPITKPQQMDQLRAYYLNKGVSVYQDKNDAAGSIQYFLKAEKVMPEDTLGYFYGGLISNEAEKFDEAISQLNKYIDLGGQSPDAYRILFSIYRQEKEDTVKALEIAKKASAALPGYSEFKRYEISMLMAMNRLDEAKVGLEKQIAVEPEDKLLHFLLGYVYLKGNDSGKAQSQFEEALKIDNSYFDAQFYLATIMTEPAVAIRKEMNSLGISAADKKRKLELDEKYVTELKKVLPQWEHAEQINPDDQDVLDRLYSIYQDLGNEQGVKRIKSKLKAMGVEVD